MIEIINNVIFITCSYDGSLFLLNTPWSAYSGFFWFHICFIFIEYITQPSFYRSLNNKNLSFYYYNKENEYKQNKFKNKASLFKNN